jgi:hypothetical protein
MIKAFGPEMMKRHTSKGGEGGKLLAVGGKEPRKARVLAGWTKLESTLDAAASHMGRSALSATLGEVVARLGRLGQWLSSDV